MSASDRVTKLAAVISEAMNLAAMVRRGDDAAWAGIGPDAHERIASELRTFVDLARSVDDDVVGAMSLPAAANKASELADELLRTGIPVTEEARKLSGEFLGCLGIGEELLNALDGEH